MVGDDGDLWLFVCGFQGSTITPSLGSYHSQRYKVQNIETSGKPTWRYYSTLVHKKLKRDHYASRHETHILK